jgi:PAS domain S-box-containing protein
MKNLFKPAITLMNLLKFPQKMAVMACIFSLPLAVFLYLLITELNTGIHLAEKEQQGVAFTQSIVKLLKDLQQHRGMSNALLSGDDSFKEHIKLISADIKEDIRSIDVADDRFGASLDTTDKWQKLKRQWHQLQSTFMEMDARESFAFHTNIIKDILTLITHVADASNLTFDPDIETSYLMMTMINKLPRSSEYAGQIRGRGAGAIAQKALSLQEKTRLTVLAGLFNSSLNELGIDMRKAFEKNTVIKTALEEHLKDTLSTGLMALEVLNSKVIITDRTSIKPADFFTSFTEAINANFKLHDAVTAAFKTLLQARIHDLNMKKYTIQAGALVFLIIVIYLFAGNYYSIMGSLANLLKASKLIGKGVFNGNIPVATKDEMAEVTVSFNEMSRSLAKFTGQLKKANEELESEIRIRTQTEAILRESERSISTLMSNLPGMAYRCLNDRDWTMKFVSEGAYDLTGYQHSDLVDNREISYAELISPEDQDTVWNDVQDALLRKHPFQLVYRINHKSGREKWVWEQGQGVYSPAGKLLALEGFIIDITERRHAESALIESEARYRVITETASDAILTLDAESIIILANPAIEQILGYIPEEIIGKKITILMPERFRSRHLNAMDKYLKTGKSTINWKGIELPGLHKNGDEIPLEISYGEFVMKDKHFFSGIIRDITERKQADKDKTYQHMLERFNKELETLVAERTMSLISLKLADRIRTPAAVIGWTGNKLLKRGDVPQKYNKGLMSIVEEADSLEATVKEFEALLITKRPVFHYEDINEIIQSFLLIIEKEAADKEAQLSVTLSEQALKVNAQRDLLRMALFTLLRNAVESVPIGGIVTLATSGDIDNVYISVANTGAGIPEGMFERIFEPENGMKVYKFGMGLPLIKQIVSEHLGEITVESEPGKGATFRIVLPSRWMKKA